MADAPIAPKKTENMDPVTAASSPTMPPLDSAISSSPISLDINVAEPETKKLKTESGTEEVNQVAKAMLDLFQAPQGMVTVSIPSGKAFRLHVDVLADKCDYFRASLTGSFLEANTKKVVLSDVSDNTFGFFLKWVYGDNIKAEMNPNFCHQHNETSLTLPGLFDLWFFADYLQAAALKNHVITNAIQKLQNAGSLATEEAFEQIVVAIRMLWKGKARTDQGEIARPLRDLLLDVVGNPRCMPKARSERLLKTMPAPFLREFALVSLERNSIVADKTDLLERGLAPRHYDSDDEDFYGLDIGEDWGVKIEMAELTACELQVIWALRPSKYFVEDPKKDKEDR